MSCGTFRPPPVRARRVSSHNSSLYQFFVLVTTLPNDTFEHYRLLSSLAVAIYPSVSALSASLVSPICWPRRRPYDDNQAVARSPLHYSPTYSLLQHTTSPFSSATHHYTISIGLSLADPRHPRDLPFRESHVSPPSIVCLS